jgi:hypothetical protein
LCNPAIENKEFFVSVVPKRTLRFWDYPVTLTCADIEDLLDLARISTGKMIIKSDLVDVRAAVEAALDSVSPPASAKAIRLDKNLQGSAPSRCW